MLHTSALLRFILLLESTPAASLVRLVRTCSIVSFIAAMSVEPFLRTSVSPSSEEMTFSNLLSAPACYYYKGGNP